MLDGDQEDGQRSRASPVDWGVVSRNKRRVRSCNVSRKGSHCHATGWGGIGAVWSCVHPVKLRTTRAAEIAASKNRTCVSMRRAVECGGNERCPMVAKRSSRINEEAAWPELGGLGWHAAT